MPRILRTRRDRIDLRRPLNPDHPLNQGKVAHWKVLPGRYGGQYWFDLVQGRQGTLTSMSGAAAGTNGFRPNAPPGGWGSVLCGGPAGYVVSLYPGPLGPAARTVLFWFSTTQNGVTDATVVGWGANSGAVAGSGWNVVVESGSLGVRAFNGATALGGGSGLNSGSWHRGGVTFPANGTCSQISAYVDGKPVSLSYGGGSTAINTLAGNPIWIGQWALGAIYFAGYVDSIAVYSIWQPPSFFSTDSALELQGLPGVLNRGNPASWFGPVGGNKALPFLFDAPGGAPVGAVAVAGMLNPPVTTMPFNTYIDMQG
jgi:hypothetical protein